jgi:hypothetical protein
MPQLFPPCRLRFNLSGIRSNRLAEALDIARGSGVDEGWVRKGYEDAERTLNDAAEVWIKNDPNAEAAPTVAAAKAPGDIRERFKAKVAAQAKPGLGDDVYDVPVSQLNKSAKKGRVRGEPVIGWPREWPEPPSPPAWAQGTPEVLLYPGGLLGHAVQFVMDTAGLPDRKLALAVALSACGKGRDRKVVGPSGNSTILFTLVIAETGAGKQHGLDCVRALLRAMGLEGCYAAGGLASVQAIEEVIEGIENRIDCNPNALVAIDEVGGWLSRVLSKGQTGNVSEIPSHLQILWGLPVEGAWIGTKKVGKEMQSWQSVAFAIIGFSTEKMFFKALKDRLIGSGFVNRMLLFNVGRGASERVDPKYSWTQCPGWLVNAFQEVTGLEMAPHHEPLKLCLPAADGSAVVLKDYHRLGWGPSVKEACRACEKEIRAMPSVEDRELWIRTHDIALRLATIVAVYRCSATVEMEDWEWAIELARHSTRQLKWGVDRHMLEELDDADLAEQIREYFRKRSGETISIGKVTKHFERKGNVKKVNDVIWHVERTGDIEKVQPPLGPGKPTVYFKWAKTR